MAGDWIAMRKDLPDDIEVIRMSAELKLMQDVVVGKLFRVWSWFDTATADGLAQHVGPDFIDHLVDCEGFAEAMRKVGWLHIRKTPAIEVPNFDRWMGSSGKKRLAHNRRVAAKRGASKAHSSITESAPEKSIEQKSNKNTRGTLPANFAEQLGVDI